MEELKRNEIRGGKGVEINLLGEICICWWVYYFNIYEYLDIKSIVGIILWKIEL